ncbi:MAG: hypothetical protein RBG13Loki_1557 [Promethearchaeota archaeon CR_4]|nr:MAG: hypothetical protein RBG13Loki_1557 [Candidatus Lokiarchaeota archaeon CR_4]
MHAPLRVHVSPFGGDNPDRIIKPAKKEKVDRLYLFTMSDRDRYAPQFKVLCQQIIDQNVVDPKELRIRKCNFFDFSELMTLNASIIREEQLANNLIYYNVSTGGAFLSITSILSCFLFKATPYYCVMHYDPDFVPDDPEIIYFPKYTIPYPSKDLIQFLAKINNITRLRQSKALSKAECLEILESLQPGKKFNERTSSKYNILKYGYLDNRQLENLISVEKNPRGKVRLTSEGEFAVQLFSSFFGI